MFVKNLLLLYANNHVMFTGAEQYKRSDVQTFYNSIYLLGEFYNKAKLANGMPINIMGTSLLDLLTSELKHELKAIDKLSDDVFSKLILTQVTIKEIKDLFLLGSIL